MLLLAISAVLSAFVLSHNGVVADDCDTKQYPPLTGKTFSYPSQIVSLGRLWKQNQNQILLTLQFFAPFYTALQGIMTRIIEIRVGRTMSLNTPF